jgi:hypothetical protein
MEQGIVAQVTTTGIVVKNNFGESVHVPTFYVVGDAKVGATCTLVARTSEGYGSFRAFVESSQRLKAV